MPALAVLHNSIGLTLDFVRETRKAVSDDLGESLVFAAALNANTSHLDADLDSSRRHAAFDPHFPIHLRRPIRISRIAESLIFPRQTIRSKVAKLAESGWAQTDRRGVVVRPERFLSAAGMAHMHCMLGAIHRFIAHTARLRACGLSSDERLTEQPGPVAWATLRLATNHMLHTQYNLRTALGAASPATDFVLLNIMHQSGLGSAGGAGRRCSAAALADQIGLPRETTRRLVNALIQRGLIVRDGQALVLADDVAARAEVLAVARAVEISTGRLIRRLRGLDAIVPKGGSGDLAAAGSRGG
jgi:hypothetical protein